jgi:hypothetical protein
MAIQGVNTPNNTYNVNQTGGLAQTNANGTTTGTGGLNSTGGPLPSALPTYAAPPPPPPMTQAELDELAQALSTSGAQMGSSGFDYDSVMSELGSLIFQYLNHQRTQAIQQRAAGYESAKSSLLQQAGEMKKAADEMDSGAVKNMAIGITTASIAMIGSGVSLGAQIGSTAKTIKAAGNVKSAEAALEEVSGQASKFTDKGMVPSTKVAGMLKQAQADFGAANAGMRKIDDNLKKFATAADITGRVGDIGRQLGSGLDTKDQAEAKRMEAEGSIDAAEATGHQQKAEMSKEIQQAVDDMAKKLLEYLNEMKQNQIEMMRSITR